MQSEIQLVCAFAVKGSASEISADTTEEKEILLEAIFLITEYIKYFV